MFLQIGRYRRNSDEKKYDVTIRWFFHSRMRVCDLIPNIWNLSRFFLDYYSDANKYTI